MQDPAGRLLALGVLAGAIGGLVAGGLDALRAGVALLGPLGDGPWWSTLFVPALGGAVAAAIVGSSGGHLGMASLIEGIQLRSEAPDLRRAAGTGLAAVVALGTGHSGGRESPLGVLASAVAGLAWGRLGLEAGERRLLLAATAAAAISASFNTPLGSAVLAMEVLLGSFALRNFGPVVVATVVGTWIGQALLGSRVAFHAPGFQLGHPWEIVAYAGLGLFAGSLAVLYARGVLWTLGQVGLLVTSPVWRAAAVGLMLGMFALAGLGDTLGTGYPLIERVLSEPTSFTAPLLVLLVLGKLASTGLTFASRLGVGLFAPVLCIGAVSGVLYGRMVGWVAPVDAASFGLVAMGALAASTFHAPLAMLLVLFELTGDFTVVPTMAVASAMAMLVSSTLGPGPLYDALLEQRGVHLDRRVPAGLRAATAGGLAHREGIVTVATDASLHDVVAAFRGTRDNLVWLVDADGRCAGAIHVQDALDALAAGSGAPPVTVVPPVSEETPAAEALHLLAGDHEEVPVLDRDGRLVGVLHERVLLELVET